MFFNVVLCCLVGSGTLVVGHQVTGATVAFLREKALTYVLCQLQHVEGLLKAFSSQLLIHKILKFLNSSLLWWEQNILGPLVKEYSTVAWMNSWYEHSVKDLLSNCLSSIVYVLVPCAPFI